MKLIKLYVITSIFCLLVGCGPSSSGHYTSDSHNAVSSGYSPNYSQDYYTQKGYEAAYKY